LKVTLTTTRKMNSRRYFVLPVPYGAEGNYGSGM
jgi:hypothetical protein